jgi:hypothetical protein
MDGQVLMIMHTRPCPPLWLRRGAGYTDACGHANTDEFLNS